MYYFLLLPNGYLKRLLFPELSDNTCYVKGQKGETKGENGTPPATPKVLFTRSAAKEKLAISLLKITMQDVDIRHYCGISLHRHPIEREGKQLVAILHSS